MTAGAAVSLRDVRVAYGAQDVLRGVSLDIEPGELIVLVGPSGCGKSTLLRSINRLVPISGGSIEIDGKNVESVDAVALRRTIGYAIQAVGLFAHMTVAENIAVVPSLLGWDRDRIAARVDELLAMVQLDPARYRSRRPRSLSGGEAQRVGVARALAAEPHLLLMDEPFGAVDALVRSQLQGELGDIVHRLGTTTIFVTHDVNEALLLADRIVVMRNGIVEQAAPPPEILARPATDYVKALVHEDERLIALRNEARV